MCLKNLLVQIYWCRLNDMILYSKKYKWPHQSWCWLRNELLHRSKQATSPWLTNLTWLMTLVYILKLLYELSFCSETAANMFYRVWDVAVPHIFLFRCKNWKNQICLCISAWLSPSLGLRSHPPQSVLFPFVILLCFLSLLHILAWLDCCA